MFGTHACRSARSRQVTAPSLRGWQRASRSRTRSPRMHHASYPVFVHRPAVRIGLPSDPASRRRPCPSPCLRLRIPGRRTYTDEVTHHVRLTRKSEGLRAFAQSFSTAGLGDIYLPLSANAARLLSVDFNPAWWSSAPIPTGTSSQCTVTSVPSWAGSSIHAIRISPENAASSLSKVTACSILSCGTSLMNRTSTSSASSDVFPGVCCASS